VQIERATPSPGHHTIWALAGVRAFGDAYGDPAAEGLGVIRTGHGGRSALLAEGAALVALAGGAVRPPSAARAS
jgi:hypothetical protein